MKWKRTELLRRMSNGVMKLHQAWFFNEDWIKKKAKVFWDRKYLTSTAATTAELGEPKEKFNENHETKATEKNVNSGVPLN